LFRKNIIPRFAFVKIKASNTLTAAKHIEKQAQKYEYSMKSDFYIRKNKISTKSYTTYIYRMSVTGGTSGPILKRM
jgi:hypothetical protein